MREPAHTNNFLPQFLKDSGCVAWQGEQNRRKARERFLRNIFFQLSKSHKSKEVN